jgi:hypothetical protein
MDDYKKFDILTNRELMDILITADGLGKTVKQVVIDVLLDRQGKTEYKLGYADGWQDGKYPQEGW